MAVMTVMAVIMYLAAPLMMGIMTDDTAIRSLGTEILRIEAWAEPMYAASIVAYGAFVGVGDTLYPRNNEFRQHLARQNSCRRSAGSYSRAARRLDCNVHRTDIQRPDIPLAYVRRLVVQEQERRPRRPSCPSLTSNNFRHKDR